MLVYTHVLEDPTSGKLRGETMSCNRMNKDFIAFTLYIGLYETFGCIAAEG